MKKRYEDFFKLETAKSLLKTGQWGEAIVKNMLKETC